MERYVLRSDSTVTVTICYKFVLDVTVIGASVHLCSKFIGLMVTFTASARCVILLHLVNINCKRVGLMK